MLLSGGSCTEAPNEKSQVIQYQPGCHLRNLNCPPPGPLHPLPAPHTPAWQRCYSLAGAAASALPYSPYLALPYSPYVSIAGRMDIQGGETLG